MFRELKWLGKVFLFVAVFLAPGTVIFAQPGQVRSSLQPGNQSRNCDENRLGLCPDRVLSSTDGGEYIGHDEPSLLFYSDVPGSGKMSIYTLILPKDPPVAPKQDGTGGTFNFQLHVAFWVGMALCDTQSAPNADKNGVCIPGTDANIFDNPDPSAPDFIGKHPGTAFMELQFYPPGWVGSSVSADQYAAALTVTSVSINDATRQRNNPYCPIKPQNFAFITRNGIPLEPANPLFVPFGKSNFDLNNVLFMNPGDTLRVTIRDSPDGLRAKIEDLTTGDSGFMVAGPAAGFGQVDFDPSASACSITPYEFHPMYSTSSEHTRVPWAGHSYNIAFSDEIGHFEYCNATDDFFECTQPGAGEASVDDDDFPCFNPSVFGLPTPPFQPITGCISADGDFDGVSYGRNWPGTNPHTDATQHPSPVRFTSPIFRGPHGSMNYERVAFETSLPLIEVATCDDRTGTGCVNPPPGAAFYPIYSTASLHDQCMWQIGGPYIPATINNFGGDSVVEYGDILSIPYPTRLFGVLFLTDNFRRVLHSNPCRVDIDDLDGKDSDDESHND